jgi:nicotinate-nucleotide--dimethylbenzimidazole phosphoribosyltransferase
VIVLVIGGTRSGKSEVAEGLAARVADRVTVLIPWADAGTDIDADTELAARVATHRARRPAAWTTVECGDALPAALAATPDVVVVDSLGTWVARHDAFAVDVDALVTALRRRDAATFVVTEEVGLSVHAPTEAGRGFADAVGLLNRAVADVADTVLLVVAGRALRLDAAGLGVEER